MNKYELSSVSRVMQDGLIVYRVRALREFGSVASGELGGFVESERNLSQEGLAWIFDNASAIDSAFVGHDAKLMENATMTGNSRLVGRGIVKGNATLCGSSLVNDDGLVEGYASLGGDVWIRHKGQVGGKARLTGTISIARNEKCFETPSRFNRGVSTDCDPTRWWSYFP